MNNDEVSEMNKKLRKHVREWHIAIERELMTQEAVDAFWRAFSEHDKRDVYESTWAAFTAAFNTKGELALAVVVENRALEAKLKAIGNIVDRYSLQPLIFGEPAESVQIGQLQVVDELQSTLKDKP